MPGISRKAMLAATSRSNGDPKTKVLPAQAMRGTRADGSGSNSPARPKTSPPSR